MTSHVVEAAPWRLLDLTVSAALAERLGVIVDEMAAGVISAVPEYATIENARFRRDVTEAVRVAVTRFIQLVGTDDAALNARVREAFVGLGAAEARENRSPEVLLSALRVSSTLLLRETVAACLLRGPVTTDQIMVLAEASSAFVDALASASADGFAVKVRELAGERDRHAHRLAELLLTGGASETVVNSAAVAIGWGSVGQLVPIVLPVEEAREARFRFRSDGLVIDRGDHLVVLVQGGPRASRAELAERLHARGAVIGPMVNRLDLPDAVRLTELASRLVSVEESEPVFVDDHLARLALKGEPAALAALARRRLAPFAELSDSQRLPLLDTLASWLRHWGARSVVADELFIHPQTVSYRIRRARSLIGPEFDEPTVRFELALVLTEWLDSNNVVDRGAYRHHDLPR